MSKLKPLLWLLPLAALLRIIYWLQIASEAWFIAPGTDPEFYNYWAEAILKGQGGDFVPFPRAPLYPYLLSGLRLLLGPGWLPPALFNLLLDLSTLTIIYHLGVRLKNQAVGIIGALLFAITGSAIYFSAETLMTSLETFLFTAFIYLMVCLLDTNSLKYSTGAGLFLGLTALCRPNALVLLPVVIILLIIKANKPLSPPQSSHPDNVIASEAKQSPPSTGLAFIKDCFASLAMTPGNLRLIGQTLLRGGSKGGLPLSLPPLLLKGGSNGGLPLIPILLITISTILVIAPVTIINWSSSREFTLISTQGGVNFYIGNARGASGWASELPGIGAAWTEADASQAAADSAHTDHLSPARESAQFLRMGLLEIATAPVSWFKLMLKKVLLLINYREIGNNRPLTLARQSSFIIKYSFYLSLGLLLPFAFWGCCYERKDSRVLILTLLLLGYAGSALLFFVTSRYRAPLLPGVCILTGIGLYRLIEKIKLRQFSMLESAVFLGMFAVVLPNWFKDAAYELPAQVEYVHGNAWQRLNRPDRALEHYHKALTLSPHYPELNLNCGVAALTRGDTLPARAYFLQEISVNPRGPAAWNNLAVILETEEDLDSARVCLERALEFRRNYPDARINLGRVLLKLGDRYVLRGDENKGEDYYLRSMQVNAEDAKPCYRAAVLELKKGNYIQMVKLLNEALRREPHYQPAKDLLEAAQGG